MLTHACYSAVCGAAQVALIFCFCHASETRAKWVCYILQRSSHTHGHYKSFSICKDSARSIYVISRKQTHRFTCGQLLYYTANIFFTHLKYSIDNYIISPNNKQSYLCRTIAQRGYHIIAATLSSSPRLLTVFVQRCATWIPLGK